MSLIPLVLRFLSRSIATIWDEKTKILLFSTPEKKLIRIKNNDKDSLTEHLFFRCLQHCCKTVRKKMSAVKKGEKEEIQLQSCLNNAVKKELHVDIHASRLITF